MIDIDAALDVVRAVPPSSQSETLPLSEALGRILARVVASPVDSPPFDKAAMDGYATGTQEDSTELRIVETVAAGEGPGREVRRGECARIMTGAPLPAGAGRVVRREYVQEGDGVVRIQRPESGDNVIRRGSSLRAGEPVLQPRVLGPQDIGILAASGIDRVDVVRPPRVRVLCTGPEIRPPGTALGPGQIYDSNGPQLRAQLAAMHCPAAVRSGVEDRPGPLAAAIAEELRSCDLLLLTGGVSAGDFDYVPRCLEEVGAEVLFHRVSIKPGKPTLFARRGEQYIFGLPGNPVSTFIIFEVFVRPFLYRRMGLDWTPATFQGWLARPLRRAPADRTEFLPVKVSRGAVTPVAYHGSAHLNALGGADGLVRIEIGVTELPEGTAVDVRPI